MLKLHAASVPPHTDAGVSTLYPNAPKRTLLKQHPVAVASIPCVSVQLRFRVLHDGHSDDTQSTCYQQVELADFEGVEEDEKNGEIFYFVHKFHKLLSQDSSPNSYSCVLYGTLIEVLDFLWQHQDIYLRVILPFSSSQDTSIHITFSMKELISTDLAALNDSCYENEIYLDPEEGTLQLVAYMRLEAYEVSTARLDALTKGLPKNIGNPFCLSLALDNDSSNMDLIQLCCNGYSPTTVKIGVRCGLVQQYTNIGVKATCRFYLVMVETWTEAVRYLRCVALNVVLILPESDLPVTTHSERENAILSLDSKPLRLKASQYEEQNFMKLPTAVATVLASSPHPLHSMSLTFEAKLHCITLFSGSVPKSAFVTAGLEEPKIASVRINNTASAYTGQSSNQHITGVASSNEIYSSIMKKPNGNNLFRGNENSVEPIFFSEIENNVVHIWRFSIDCLAIQLSFSASKVYLKYEFTAFGALKPFQTHPAVECRKNEMTRLYNGFCAYSFTQTTHNLNKILNENPLLIQIWSRDTYKEDQFVGEVLVDLSTILEQPVLTSLSQSNSRIPYRSIDGIYYLQCNETKHFQGFVRCQLFLEDLGVTSLKEVNENFDVLEMPQVKNESRGNTPFSLSEAEEIDTRKQKGMTKLSMLLQKQETELLQRLEEQYKLKDSERQKEFEAKKNQLHQLEVLLRRKSQELHQQASELESQQIKLKHEQDDLRALMQRNSEDYNASCRRLKQEHEQTIYLESEKNRELSERKNLLQAELEEMRERVRKLENEAIELKQRIYDTPSYPLQSDLKVKTFEVEDLKAKLEAMTSSRDHFLANCAALLEKLGEVKRQEMYSSDNSWQADFADRLKAMHQSMQDLQSFISHNTDGYECPLDAISTKRKNHSIGKSSNMHSTQEYATSRKPTLNNAVCAAADIRKHSHNKSLNSNDLGLMNRAPNRTLPVGKEKLATKNLNATASTKLSVGNVCNKKDDASSKQNAVDDQDPQDYDSYHKKLTFRSRSQSVLPNHNIFYQHPRGTESNQWGNIELPAISQVVIPSKMVQESIETYPLNEGAEIEEEREAFVSIASKNGKSGAEHTATVSTGTAKEGTNKRLENEIERLLELGIYADNDKTIESIRDKLKHSLYV